MFKRNKKEKKQLNLKSEELTTNDLPVNISILETTVDNSFFYTNDKFFDQMDFKMIIDDLILMYPGFNSINSDTEIKHAFLDMLQNKDYVNSILDQYNLTIMEFIKMMCKNYTSIFKGMFLRKIKNILEEYEK